MFVNTAVVYRYSGMIYVTVGDVCSGYVFKKAEILT